MTDQYRRSPLSQATVQRSPESSLNLVSIGGQGYSTQLWGLPAPDTRNSGKNWNGSLFPSMAQQHGNGLYPPTVGQVDTMVNMYSPLLGHSPNHYPTHTPSDETSVAINTHQGPYMTICSLPDDFLGPQMRVEVYNDQFVVQVDSVADRATRSLSPLAHVDTDTPLSRDQMANESWAITEVVASSSDHEHFTAKSLPNECSCSPTSFTHSTSDATRLHTMPQEANLVLRTHKEGEHLVTSTPAPPPQSRTRQNRGVMAGKMAKKPYQCNSCCLSFSQRQGLKRHSKDKHEPKIQCSFCVEFTWSKGRRYVYRRHLEQEHPDVVSPRVSATPVARGLGLGRRVNLKDWHFRRDYIARRIS